MGEASQHRPPLPRGAPFIALCLMLNMGGWLGGLVFGIPQSELSWTALIALALAIVAYYRTSATMPEIKHPPASALAEWATRGGPVAMAAPWPFILTVLLEKRAVLHWGTPLDTLAASGGYPAALYLAVVVVNGVGLALFRRSVLAWQEELTTEQRDWSPYHELLEEAAQPATTGQVIGTAFGVGLLFAWLGTGTGLAFDLGWWTALLAALGGLAGLGVSLWIHDVFAHDAEPPAAEEAP